MNARFLEKFIVYREKHRISFCRTMLVAKVRFQFALIKDREAGKKYLNEFDQTDSIQALLLVEARAAKEYWKKYASLLTSKSHFLSRDRKSKDTVNILLNIGYHYLFQKVKNECVTLDIPVELGFFHKAQSKRSNPFVYDSVEWLRPFVVDRTLLAMVRKKKKNMCHLKREISRYSSQK